MELEVHAHTIGLLSTMGLAAIVLICLTSRKTGSLLTMLLI